MEVADARTEINRIVNARWIVLFPDDWESWITAPYAAGPFSARLVLDPDRGLVRNEVVAAEVVPGAGLFDALRAVPFPKPDVTQYFGDGWTRVVISYPMPLERTAVEEEVLGLFSAGLLFSTDLCRRLMSDLRPDFAERLAGFDFDGARGFTHDPRDFLRRPSIEPWPASTIG